MEELLLLLLLLLLVLLLLLLVLLLPPQMNQPRASVMTPWAAGGSSAPITTPIASITPYQVSAELNYLTIL